MKKIAFALCALMWAPQAFAEIVPVDSPRWRLDGAEARVVEHLGRPAIALRAAQATLPDADFDTGVIEFDIATPQQRGFPGLLFRGVDDANAEHFYFRPHQSGNPDANQYTPIINGVTGWQIYYGTNYSAPTRYRFDEWMHVRIEVAADSARVFIDSETPTLVIHDLKRDRASGYLALQGIMSTTYYSNFSYERGPQADAPPEEARELAPGLVRTWAVSGAMPEEAAYAAASANRLGALDWTPLAVESNGVANLARVAVPTEEAQTALARIHVRADRARNVRLRFGFSDRLRLYLNGVALYDGEDLQASRDYRFLGTVGLFDAVHLALRRGDNEIVLAVTEPLGSGGWAANAAFDDMTGLSIVEPD